MLLLKYFMTRLSERLMIVATDADPIVGNWYEHLDKGLKFEVIAVDEDEGLVEIQYFDGDLEEIDLDNWYDLEIEVIEAPEDWTGPIDDIEEDDLGYTETDMGAEDWSDSRQEFKRKQEAWEEESEAPDELGEGYPEEEPWEGEA